MRGEESEPETGETGPGNPCELDDAPWLEIEDVPLVGL